MRRGSRPHLHGNSWTDERRRGLIDAYQLVVHPVVLGAGTPFFPPLDRQLDLRLVETRRFASGVVLLSYAAA
jgi:dihydrofolate reductase